MEDIALWFGWIKARVTVIFTIEGMIAWERLLTKAALLRPPAKG